MLTRPLLQGIHVILASRTVQGLGAKAVLMYIHLSKTMYYMNDYPLMRRVSQSYGVTAAITWQSLTEIGDKHGVSALRDL